MAVAGKELPENVGYGLGRAPRGARSSASSLWLTDPPDRCLLRITFTHPISSSPQAVKMVMVCGRCADRYSAWPYDINPIYHDTIKALYPFLQSIKHPSTDFVGLQAANIFYLDSPHNPLQPPTQAAERERGGIPILRGGLCRAWSPSFPDIARIRLYMREDEGEGGRRPFRCR
ncbi:hypothetical protein EI94DRAFT_868761 [Lactarius quietus]|nr:hypothetical protein EI94DRAFT_868761 [Lactarius quietus]